MAAHIRAGEDEAHARLEEFLTGDVAGYKADRDHPWRPRATSGLSDALAVGEISARRIWSRCRGEFAQGIPGIEPFLSEVCWREFARELMAETPDMDRSCWRKEWNDFPWRADNDDAEPGGGAAPACPSSMPGCGNCMSRGGCTTACG
ncbi:hypothetical protein [Paracoccus sp. PAMC 22219]|uniref:hypothetical protein n=1 Tax=Paracoccus sp. PAMC 22219 TaxID=1569209 RepID=UPI0027D8D283|nr:hypothetical protein [Paracoccus sp. PAMC 22219]